MVNTTNKFKLLALTCPSAEKVIEYLEGHDYPEAREALLTTDNLRKHYCATMCKRPGGGRYRLSTPIPDGLPDTCLILPECWCVEGWPVRKQSNKDYFGRP